MTIYYLRIVDEKFKTLEITREINRILPNMHTLYSFRREGDERNVRYRVSARIGSFNTDIVKHVFREGTLTVITPVEVVLQREHTEAK